MVDKILGIAPITMESQMLLQVSGTNWHVHICRRSIGCQVCERSWTSRLMAKYTVGLEEDAQKANQLLFKKWNNLLLFLF